MGSLLRFYADCPDDRASREVIGVFPEKTALEDDRCSFNIDVDLKRAFEKGRTLVIDVYKRDFVVSVSDHIGAWRFRLEDCAPSMRIDIFLDETKRGNLRLNALENDEEKRVRPFEGRINKKYKWAPVQAVSIEIWDDNDEAVFSNKVLFSVSDERLLADYYGREGHQEVYAARNIFIERFHAARLRVIGKCFKKYLKNCSKVVDVGSGHSIFSMVSDSWDFEITCCDLDKEVIENGLKNRNDYEWVYSDVSTLPFEDESFDGLYAGEIIEHLVDPEKGLDEWMRVLKPGGTMILTTPNAARLINRVNCTREDANSEHISEMTYAELKSLFKSKGLKVLDRKGIYLEFFFNYFRRGQKVDLLPRRMNYPKYEGFMDFSMRLGELFPRAAFNLVFVLKKKS